MKKILCFVLAAFMIVSVFALTGCGNKKEDLKFGFGVDAAYGSFKDATEEKAGSGKATENLAAVLLDKDGKIVKCVIDVSENTLSYNADGTYVAVETFKTKLEKGDEYGMRGKSEIGKEWYEQAAAFESVCVGKTVDEVKALVAENGDGVEDVINAGCTITVSGFVNAVVKACENAVAVDATSDCTIAIGTVSAQTSCKNATDEAEGAVQVDSTFAATVKGKDGKVIAVSFDVVQAKVKFDKAGKVTSDMTAALKSKRALGTDYNMAAYGSDKNGDGIVKEWFEQAAIFEGLCVGKTAAEIEALAASDGYGVEAVQTACCTMHVSDLIKAAVKSIG